MEPTSSIRSSRSRHRVSLVAAALVTLALTVAACGGDGDGGGSSSSDAAGPELSAAGKRGQVVASDNGCTACHSTDGSRSTGPTWKGLAGAEVKLDDGSAVTADAEYLARSVTDPRSQVVDGYANIMPASYGHLSDAEVDDLVAYLRDLAR